ncbi:MAG: hypothetical protein CMA31_03025 [Euryarchaeota archaeon]|nr:hypothetical protein [Euryarchaeota archaeon]|tara:strand:+ start:3590 stop:4255 length:666 start_codon:yes stop_codon:yes gene_type:complete
MKKLFIAIAFVLLFTSPLKAAELLMFSNPNCGYCQNFLKEVEPTYSQSEAGRLMPLHIIQMDKPVPDWYINAFKAKAIGRIAGTPTFIVWVNDQEEGRFVGYPGKEQFYAQLNDFIKTNGHLFGGEAFLGKQKKEQWKGTIPAPRPVPELPVLHPVPEGVVNSHDIFDHTYDTAEKALAAADYLDCATNIHYHAKENVWMPCSMAISPGTDDLMKGQHETN